MLLPTGRDAVDPLHVWLRLPWSVEMKSTPLAALLDPFVNNQKSSWCGIQVLVSSYVAPCNPLLLSELGAPLRGHADLGQDGEASKLAAAAPLSWDTRAQNWTSAFDSRARLHLKELTLAMEISLVTDSSFLF